MALLWIDKRVLPNVEVASYDKESLYSLGNEGYKTQTLDSQSSLKYLKVKTGP